MSRNRRTPFTLEEHQRQHVKWHNALDELLADWISSSPPYPGKTLLPSKHTIMELMAWSHEQTIAPSLPPGWAHRVEGEKE